MEFHDNLQDAEAELLDDDEKELLEVPLVVRVLNEDETDDEELAASIVEAAVLHETVELTSVVLLNVSVIVELLAFDETEVLAVAVSELEEASEVVRAGVTVSLVDRKELSVVEVEDTRPISDRFERKVVS